MWLRGQGIYGGFVYGKENAHVVRALRQLSKDGNREPVLLMGGSGTGKSLLLQAFRQQQNARTGLRVQLEQGVDFVGRLVEAIYNKETRRFISHYRTDLLLLDDLTCLRDKFSSQQEVVHQLKYFAEQGIQVVLTALPMADESMGVLYHLFPGNVLELRTPSEKTVRRIIAYHADKRAVSLRKHQIDQIAEKTSGNGFLVEGEVTLQHFYQYVVADMKF